MKINQNKLDAELERLTRENSYPYNVVWNYGVKEIQEGWDAARDGLTQFDNPYKKVIVFDFNLLKRHLKKRNGVKKSIHHNMNQWLDWNTGYKQYHDMFTDVKVDIWNFSCKN